MRDQATFETRLTDAFERYAAAAPVAVDARALTRSLAAAGAARPSLADRWAGLLGARRLMPLALLVALAAAAAVAGALLLRLLDQPPRVFGAFEPVPGWNLSDPLHAAAPLPDGRVLLLGQGGGPEAPAWLYDPATGRAEPTGSMVPGRYGATLVTLREGRVLVLGGYTNVGQEGTSVDLPSAQLYDPTTGTFADTGRMDRVRRDPTAVVMADGRVLVFGGEGAAALAEVYDPERGTFTATGSLRSGRMGARAVALADGRVLVAGGDVEDVDAWRPTATAEIYDPMTGAFTPTASMGAPRDYPSLTLLADGRVLVAGGTNEDGELASAEIFDPATGTFAPTGSLTTERAAQSATLLADGRVLVAGGSNRYGEPRTAELYDPASGRFERAGAAAGAHQFAVPQNDGGVLVLGETPPEVWAPVEPVAAPKLGHVPGPGFGVAEPPVANRQGHTATLLSDGRVLIAGGMTQDHTDGNPPDVLRSAEVFDPASGRFTRVGDMTAPRRDHAAALLRDGRVLIVGGDVSTDPSGTERPLTGEVFDPSTGRFTALDARLGWGQIGCGADLPALRDGRVLLLADCAGGDYVQVVDSATKVQNPVPVNGCLDGPGSSALLSDGRVLVVCPSGPAFGFLVEPRDGSVAPLRPSGPVGLARFSGATTLADGRVLLTADGGAALFDPATGSSTRAGPMADRRDQPRSTLLADGRVLVSGGRVTPLGRGDGTGAPLASAELFDQATGFRSVGPMADARAGQTATLLRDGRVLIVGGSLRSPDRTDPDPVGAEIFDPAGVP